MFPLLMTLPQCLLTASVLAWRDTNFCFLPVLFTLPLVLAVPSLFFASQPLFSPGTTVHSGTSRATRSLARPPPPPSPCSSAINPSFASHLARRVEFTLRRKRGQLPGGNSPALRLRRSAKGSTPLPPPPACSLVGTGFPMLVCGAPGVVDIPGSRAALLMASFVPVVILPPRRKKCASASSKEASTGYQPSVNFQGGGGGRGGVEGTSPQSRKYGAKGEVRLEKQCAIKGKSREQARRG